MTTPPPLVLFLMVLAPLASGCDREAPAEASEAVSAEIGGFAHPALRVAWLQARQREGGAAYALAPAAGWLADPSPVAVPTSRSPRLTSQIQRVIIAKELFDRG